MSARLGDYDYVLPRELIAQRPLPRREDSRMMVLHRAQQKIEHRRFRALKTFLTREIGDARFSAGHDAKPSSVNLHGGVGGAARSTPVATRNRNRLVVRSLLLLTLPQIEATRVCGSSFSILYCAGLRQA